MMNNLVGWCGREGEKTNEKMVGDRGEINKRATAIAISSRWQRRSIGWVVVAGRAGQGGPPRALTTKRSARRFDLSFFLLFFRPPYFSKPVKFYPSVCPPFDSSSSPIISITGWLALALKFSCLR